MMEVDVLKGKYVLAVSGGVDSMVLLDVLAARDDLDLVVAHFDHGIRIQSKADARFVRKAATARGLPFYVDEARLGPDASEELARSARYRFLNRVKSETGSKAIITAHHQDDLIETAIINLLRGTGPTGLVAMVNNKAIIRPLLKYQKADVLDYARQNKLMWAEDLSNRDVKYLRNYIRQRITGRLSKAQKMKLTDNIYKIQSLTAEINKLTDELSKDLLLDNHTLDRSAFSMLPSAVGNELLLRWLKNMGVVDLDRKTINRLAMAIKTARPSTSADIKDGLKLDFSDSSVQMSNTER